MNFGNLIRYAAHYSALEYQKLQHSSSTEKHLIQLFSYCLPWVVLHE